MTQEYFLNLAKFNIWANNKVHEWLGQITDSQWDKQLIGSMESISATAIHIASAEKIWHERLIGISLPFLASYFNGNKSELIEIWQKASENLENFINNSPEGNLTEKFEYKNLKGEVFFSKRFEVLAHIFNHSTYHRGQIVNYLRQVGFTGFTSTDLIQFYRNQDQ